MYLILNVWPAATPVYLSLRHNTYYQRGIIYYEKNNDDEALKNFDLALKYDPKNHPAAYYYRGNIYSKKEDYNAAIKDYEKSIKIYLKTTKNDVASIDDSVGDVYHNMGIAYIRLGNFDKALTCLIGATRYYKAYGNEQALKETEELVTILYNNMKNIKQK